MKLRCWPGCLAYISSSGVSSNVGAVVKVVRLIQQTPPEWFCTSERVLAGFVPRTRRLTSGRKIDVLDADLRPIIPPPISETTDTDQPLTVEV